MRIHMMVLVVAGVMLLPASPRQASAIQTAAAADTQQCGLILTDDIKSVTGINVTQMARDTTRGARGSCTNFLTTDGRIYMTVDRYGSISEYEAAKVAVLRDVYPTRENIQGLADEGILFKGASNARMLMAHKGGIGIAITLYGTALGMTDAQIRQVAERAVARMTASR